jgi:predicted double-glycine peptidase
MVIIDDFPTFRQTTNYTCGAACVKVVLEYMGLDYGEMDLAKLLKSNKDDGTNFNEMAKFIRKHGAYTSLSPMTVDDLKVCINDNAPVIVAIQAWNEEDNHDYSTEWSDGHYVVVIGYDDENNRLYFEDPSDDKRNYLPVEEFKKRWHDHDANGKIYINYGLAIY